jgi:hypothetical protein
MAALRWFMDNQTSFNQTLMDLCLRLANFVRTNNYVECKELGCDIYHQHIGTAMRTSVSVVYAVIFMIHLESPISEDPRFRPFIELCKRFIDDIFLIWTGRAATLCEFRRALGSADDTIKLNWGGCESQTEALDHTVVEAKRHDRPEFLDLNICVDRSRPATRTVVGSWYLTFKPYRKPGNAHTYIPFTSFHAQHTLRGLVLAELLRLLTHSSTVEIWQEPGGMGIFLPLSVLTRLPTRVPQSCLSRNHMDSNLSADTDFGRTARAGRARAQSCTTRDRPRELNPRRMAAPRGYGRAPPAPARRRRSAMAL